MTAPDLTLDELRDLYKMAYRIADCERRWRAKVFREGDDRRQEKLGEMDKLIDALTRMKDALKARLEAEQPPTFEQPALIDVPVPTKYN